MKGKQRLYIAYGSNLNLEQMAFRCPTAKVVGKSELKDYELLFRGGRRGAVATVEPKAGSTVPGRSKTEMRHRWIFMKGIRISMISRCWRLNWMEKLFRPWFM